MDHIYTEPVLDILEHTAGDTALILKDYHFEDRVYFSGYVKDIFNDENYLDNLSHSRVAHISIVDNTLVIQMV